MKISSTDLSTMKLSEFNELIKGKGNSIVFGKDESHICSIAKSAFSVTDTWLYTDFSRYSKKMLRLELKNDPHRVIKVISNRDSKVVCYIKK